MRRRGLSMSKKTKLIVGGCSYTYGGNNEDTIYDNWAVNLAERLDMELVNTARNGAGNEFILTKLTEAIHTHNNIGLVVAMWSEFARIDFPQSPKAQRFMIKDDEVYRHNEGSFNEKYSYWSTVNANVYEGVKDRVITLTAKRRRRAEQEGIKPSVVARHLARQNKTVMFFHENDVMFSKIKCLEKSLLQMVLFKQLVKSKGLNYIQCVGVNPYHRGEEHTHHKRLTGQKFSKEILESIYFNELDEPNFVGFPIMREIGGYWFDTLLPVLSNQNNKLDLDYRISEDDSHPNTKGHKIFADKLYDEYIQIYG